MRPTTLRHPSPKEMISEIEKASSPQRARKANLLKATRTHRYQFRSKPRVKPLLLMTKPSPPEHQKVFAIQKDKIKRKQLLEKIEKVIWSL